MLGKKVITFGKCDYSALTYNCKSYIEINDALSNVLLLNKQPCEENYTEQLFDYLYCYHVPYDDRQFIRKRINTLLKAEAT